MTMAESETCMQIIYVKMDNVSIYDRWSIFKWVIGLPAALTFYNEDLGKRMPTSDVEVWCKAQCSGAYRSLAVGPFDRTADVYLHFELERDAVLFKLFFA